MSTYHEEAAMAHGAGNPMWNVTYLESFSGKEPTAPLLAQVGSTDGLVATRHGED